MFEHANRSRRKLIRLTGALAGEAEEPAIPPDEAGGSRCRVRNSLQLEWQPVFHGIVIKGYLAS
jgi:hypothetical protein